MEPVPPDSPTPRAAAGSLARAVADSPAGPAAPARATTSVFRPAIVYALLFGAQGAYLPYIPIYLASTGLDLGTVGALIALFAVVSLVAAPSWGALADGIGDVRGPVVVAGFLSGGAVLLLALAVGPLALAGATILLAATFAGVIPMIDSQTVRLLGQRDRFGQARAPGSGAFVVVAFATGAVLGVAGPGGMFLVYGPLVILTGLGAWALLRLPPSTMSPATRAGRRSGSGATGRALAGLSPATILGVLQTPRLGVFFVAAVVVWTSHAALQGFISIRVQELGGDAAAIAATWSLGAVIEVFLMAGFPALARRFGAERLIVVGAFSFAIRALIVAIVDQPVAIVLASAFGGVGFSFFYVGTVTWVAGSVGRGVQATAQGIFTGTSNSIGAIGGSVVGGAIGAVFGLRALFAIAAVGYAAGAVLTWVAIARRPPATTGRLPD
ncbi:MAG TPA: MFS transporter [Verrucomicrobiae bacterium]|jgi:PPP family 3-phenylpropionic acid transporter|nr:MFS transporter [Verrucomicrobiae bacterium]